MINNIEQLQQKARWVRNKALQMCVNAGAGHIAPAFSCTEILVCLYYAEILRVNPHNLTWEERDRFILSKGQGCVALYTILADLGFFPVTELDTYTRLGSRLGGHSESNVPGVEAFTGSLGHGLSIGAGISLAAKIDKKEYLTVVLLGDGECQEGSVWEAAMFAAHYQLNNLIVIVDRNGLQAIDFTEKSVALEPLSEKWKAFGWEAETADGHSFENMLSIFSALRSRKSSQPLAIIANTIKGKGISFMESSPIWHYRIPVGDQLIQARRELSE